MRTLVYRSYAWLYDTIIIVYSACRLVPWQLNVLNVVIQVALLSMTEWYPILFVGWYAISWLIYLISPKYRDLYSCVVATYRGLLS